MALAINNLHFGYRGGEPVLRAVSFDAPAGAVTALLGPNGAGKSTLLRVALGLEPAQSGKVRLGGSDVRALSRDDRVRRMIYVPQASEVAFPFSVRAVVGMAMFRSGGRRLAADVVENALHTLDIAGVADVPVGRLSVGQRQRVTVARAVAQAALHGPATGEARCLLADEPVAAMDPRHAVRVMDLLRNMAGSGMAVIVVLHDLAATLAFADRAVVLDGSGRVAASGRAAEVVRSGILEPVFGLPLVEVSHAGKVVDLIPSTANGIQSP